MALNIALLALVACTSFQMSTALSSDEIQVFKDSGAFTIIERSRAYIFKSDGIPDHEHGPFPNRGNPNEVKAQDHKLVIKKSPRYSNSGYCLAMGTIGVAINGVPLYNPYTNQGTNAVVNERFDDCDGHPDGTDAYHYHQIPDCVYDAAEGNQLVGVALDGYPIYGEIDADGKTVTSSDLDICHGRWEEDESGQQVYRYRLTRDFPYILGCYRGVPSKIGGHHCLFTSVAGENPSESGMWTNGG